MSNTKRLCVGIALSTAFLLLILDVKCAAEGVCLGIELCLRSVIPAIFPFLILSPMLAACFPQIPILRPLGKMIRIPIGSEGILLTGFLCGYPVGAQIVKDAWKNGSLTTTDAQRMLAFCNNAGPAFIFGIGSSLFTEGWCPWLLWGIHILSAMICGYLLPGGSTANTKLASASTPSLRKTIEKAVVTTGYICGWIIVFRVILSFLQRWFLWFFPGWVHVICAGILELASGCSVSCLLESTPVRFVLLSAFFAFGGISVHMQTASVVAELNGVRQHLHGKLLQCAVSILLSSLFMCIIYHESTMTLTTVTTAASILLWIFKFKRKNSSILLSCDV